MKFFIKNIGFIISLFLVFDSYGQYDPTLKGVLVGDANQLKNNAFVTVRDPKFDSAGVSNIIDTPYSVQNIITFKINESSSHYLRDKFSATINVRIIYTAFNKTVDSIASKSFTINYDPLNPYKASSTFIFSGAHEVTVKILSIDSSVNWNVTKALMVENIMKPQPHYKFNCTSAINNISFTDSLKQNADELFVTWNTFNGSSEYDLEWVYVDSSALARGMYGSPAEESKLFANNGTRISISQLSYSIPLIYDNTGTLFFRIRPVSFSALQGRIEGKWNFVNSTSQTLKYEFKGHQRNLNWQSTTSYAEDGKRKVVVQYFDGSLRNRQTVTKDNSTNTTVVSETFYDYQGRPAIQVLPAPTLSSIIQYSKNFNVGLNGEYDKSNYDTIRNTSCNDSAAILASTSGASQYYSQNNPDISNPDVTKRSPHKYLPNAAGYPFTETKYTPDNTGRISSQGGVGPNHVIGSNHETKYSYGTPDRNELDALFGTEAGDNTHYFKNMVRDANGQYSVSYVDMHGRTIATALAGDPNKYTGDWNKDITLDRLTSNVSRTIRETLSNPTTTIIKELVMESKKGLLVSKEGLHKFSYSLNPESLKKEGCSADIICYDCLYDLRITITDDCNNQKLGGKAFDTTIRNFSLNSIDTTCNNNPLAFTFNFDLNLKEGSYEVTKELSISRYGLDYYRDSVFMRKNACKSLEQFIQEQRALNLKTQCQPACQSCTDSIGTWDQFRINFLQRAGIANTDSAKFRGTAWASYIEATDNCKLLCDSVNENDNIRRAMLLDMTAPTGQYADIQKMSDLRSIFYSANENDIPEYKENKYVYLNEAGQPDSVYDPAAATFVKPQNLSPEEFSKNFKVSWAEALLKFHPEY
ncbi:MAG TPA: DUF6443 domain-containing protein, partial [Segetibacter sp.]